MAYRRFWGTVFLFSALIVAGYSHGANKDYVLGPGDIVKITVYEHPDLATEVRISQGDAITFPLIGEVKIGGDTTAAAERKIANMLAQGGFVNQAQVNVVVSQFHSQEVYVLGQVNKPGKYPLDGASTVLDMIAVAGGVSKEGADRAVLVHQDKEGPVRKDIDLLEPFYPDQALADHDGKIAANLDVSNDDVIFVPRAPQFYVYGEVQHPGAYRLEREMTVMQALSVAGGFTQRANDDKVSIKRRDKAGKVVTLPSHDLSQTVQPNDVIYVKASLF